VRILAGSVALAVVLALGLVIGLSSAPASTQVVTISYERYVDLSCGCWRMRFFGRVSSAAPKEYVGLLQKTCGASSYGAVSGTQTAAGGTWEADTYFGGSSASYLASWNNELSAPVTYKPPLVPQVKRLGPGKYRIAVLSWEPQGRPQNMKGDPVQVQRSVAGLWQKLLVAKLAPRPGGGPDAQLYAATVMVAKGLELRALLPTKSALPCFAAGVSKEFRSS